MKYKSPGKFSTALFTLIFVKIVYNISLVKLLFIVHKIGKISYKLFFPTNLVEKKHILMLQI